MTNNQPTILPSLDFDIGTKTAAPDIQSQMAAIQEEARAHNLDYQALREQADSATGRDAPGVMRALLEAATIFYLQWRRARQQQEVTNALALARLFNGLTYQARTLHKRYDLIDTAHLQRLTAALQKGRRYLVDPDYLAQALAVAATAHTHDRAWPWVVLPTFVRQPYGRILLLKVNLDDVQTPIFVTQPFFLEGQSTLYHTHGQNWALARPLGQGEYPNTHLNTMWEPRCREQPFPLVQLDEAEYSNTDTVVIPPRVIHGITRKPSQPQPIPPLSEILSDDNLKAELINNTRFGELGCMHIYCAHPPLAEQLAKSPVVQSDDRFFMENDMIVFDHVSEIIWSGAGGSWPRRMIEFGTHGEHCGLCFEDDPRKENLDPAWCGSG